MPVYLPDFFLILIAKPIIMGKGSTLQNLGYPLNTPDDEILFIPVASGKSGYSPIYKESEGFIREDIYFITFKK